VAGGQTVKVTALGVAGTGIPAKGVEAVVLTVTATGATANAGYVTTYPASAVRPTTSTLNYVKGRSTANLVVAPVDETGAIRLYNGSSGKVHLIVDVAGYLLAPDLTWSAADEVDRFHSVLAKVSCPTATFCIGVDGFGDASVFNGSSWAAPQNIDARRALQSVSCPTTTF
jgi:hypothetical protein